MPLLKSFLQVRILHLCTLDCYNALWSCSFLNYGYVGWNIVVWKISWTRWLESSVLMLEEMPSWLYVLLLKRMRTKGVTKNYPMRSQKTKRKWSVPRRSKDIKVVMHLSMTILYTLLVHNWIYFSLIWQIRIFLWLVLHSWTQFFHLTYKLVISNNWDPCGRTWFVLHPISGVRPSIHYKRIFYRSI